MGTHTTYGGVLDIEPPLTWSEIQQSVSWRGHPDHSNVGWGSTRYGATLVLREEVVDTPEGSLIRRTAEAVEITGDELRHDGVMHDLRALARLFGAEHRFVSHLECRHDHPDDPVPFRVRIDGTEVIEIKPVILWPGDEKAETIVATALRRTLGVEWPDEALTVARRILHDLTDLNRRK